MDARSRVLLLCSAAVRGATRWSCPRVVYWKLNPRGAAVPIPTVVARLRMGLVQIPEPACEGTHKFISIGRCGGRRIILTRLGQDHVAVPSRRSGRTRLRASICLQITKRCRARPPFPPLRGGGAGG